MFQSTRPAWGATCLCCASLSGLRFQSTRPAWGATSVFAQKLNCFVSIHAPRVGRDSVTVDRSRIGVVSIHAPRVGRDLPSSRALSGGSLFQSTRPAWGATKQHEPPQGETTCFNPRAPRGARRHIRRPSRYWACFNPRAPRGARQKPRRYLIIGNGVSIHAPRVGRDGAGFPYRFRQPLFQSTRPAWGATLFVKLPCGAREVSIHAPRVGRDGPPLTNSI